MFIKRDEFVFDLMQNYLINLSASESWLFAANVEDDKELIKSDETGRSFLESVIFGIKYNPTDFSFMLPNIAWAEGAIYNEFDDKSDNENFYVVVQPESQSGSYHVFKCISNSNGKPSTEKPEFSSLIQDGIYRLGDGYIWKYMTSTPYTLFKKFAARNLLPIYRNQAVENIANTGIFKIKIEDDLLNVGYERIIGRVARTDVGSGSVVVYLRNVTNETPNISATANRNLAFQISNNYINRSVLIKKDTPSNQIGAFSYDIVGSGLDVNGEPFVIVSQNEAFTIQENDSFEILPKIEIIGNGSGAVAVPVFEGRHIVSIDILNPGSGYTKATASVVEHLTFDENTDRECLLRPVISPIGGHGANALLELKSKHLGISKLVSSFASSTVPSSGAYNAIGLIKSPQISDTTLSVFDNRLRISLDVDPEIQLASIISVGGTVSQTLPSGLKVSGVVHEVDDNKYTKTISSSVGQGSDTLLVSSSIDIVPGQIVEPRVGIGNGVRVVSVSGNSIVISSPITEAISEGETVSFITKDIYVSRYVGTNNEIFDEDTSLDISESTDNIAINSIVYSPYEQRTGTVLTTSFLNRIERKSDRTEQTKIIIEF
jgi:hypothetical protein